MAKLRKMLGSAEAPGILTLMRLIETQSKQTLAGWAADCAADYLGIYEAAFPQDTRLRALVDMVHACLAGAEKPAALKPLVREARQLAGAADAHPAAQAAARAVTTACGVLQTPTNALGFVFYGAAAAAYAALGLQASAEEYDAFAAAEFDRLAERLRAVLVPDEANPAKINWHC